MRLNISLYSSLNQNVPEVEINHSHNAEVINFYLRNYRYYEEQQSSKGWEFCIVQHYETSQKHQWFQWFDP